MILFLMPISLLYLPLSVISIDIRGVGNSPLGDTKSIDSSSFSLADHAPFDMEILHLSNAHGFNHTTYIPRSQVTSIYNKAVEGSSESKFFVGLFYLFGFMGPSSTTTDDTSMTIGSSFGSQDWEKALKWLSESAADGFTDAQVALGILLYDKERKSALTWIFQAAMSGNHNKAHYLFARALCEGSSLEDIGIQKVKGESRYEKAAKHLRKAQDVPEAMHLLAVLYEYGLIQIQGRIEDTDSSTSNHHFVEAMKIYRLAANMGSRESLYNLGLMYTYGRGTNIDHQRAFDLFRQAAEKKDAQSFRFMALLAMKNQDQPNPHDASYWLQKCIDLADRNDLKETCKQELDKVQQVMDSISRNYEKLRNEYMNMKDL